MSTKSTQVRIWNDWRIKFKKLATLTAIEETNAIAGNSNQNVPKKSSSTIPSKNVKRAGNERGEQEQEQRERERERLIHLHLIHILAHYIQQILGKKNTI